MNQAPSRAVSVVVPLFNEEENVPILQSELAAALAGLDYEIIFVDDGSSDRTVERIAPGPQVRVLRFEKNAGQSAAMYAGLHNAHGETAVLIDGDLQNDPADIRRLLAEIERGADLVCGYRAQRKDTLTKRITSRVANFVRSRFAKDGVRDTGCTLKAMRRECIGALVPFKGMHRFIPGAGERRGVSSGRGPGEPSAAEIWPEQIRPREPRHPRDHGYVRCALAALAPAELQSARDNACHPEPRRRARDLSRRTSHANASAINEDRRGENCWRRVNPAPVRSLAVCAARDDSWGTRLNTAPL